MAEWREFASLGREQGPCSKWDPGGNEKPNAGENPAELLTLAAA